MCRKRSAHFAVLLKMQAGEAKPHAFWQRSVIAVARPRFVAERQRRPKQNRDQSQGKP